jgi:hypothetical protein
VLSTQCNKSMRDNIVNVFGAGFLATLVPLEVRHSSWWELYGHGYSQSMRNQGPNEGMAVVAVHYASDSRTGPHCIGGSFLTGQVTLSGEEAGGSGAGIERRVSGFVSKAGEGVGRSDNDRQFFFLNGRPVNLPRITKLVNEVSARGLGTGQWRGKRKLPSLLRDSRSTDVGAWGGTGSTRCP